MFRLALVLLTLLAALVGCGKAPMTPDTDSELDASSSADAGELDASSSGVDWPTASAASLQGSHIRRTSWTAGAYAYRMSSGVLWRYVPGDSPPSQYWEASPTDRAALDWEILP